MKVMLQLIAVLAAGGTAAVLYEHEARYGDDTVAYASMGQGERSGRGQDRTGAGSSDRELERQMAEIINDYRKEAGMEPLARDGILRRASQEHAQNMCKNAVLAHSSSGDSLHDRVRSLGYEVVRVGQNIAKQENSDYVELSKAWLGSDEHRRNIFGDYTNTEVVTCRDRKGDRYWVQIFGRNAGNKDIGVAGDVHKMQQTLTRNNPAVENDSYVVMLKPCDGNEDDADNCSPRHSKAPESFGGFKPLRPQMQKQLLDQLRQLLNSPSDDSTEGPSTMHGKKRGDTDYSISRVHEPHRTHSTDTSTRKRSSSEIPRSVTLSRWTEESSSTRSAHRTSSSRSLAVPSISFSNTPRDTTTVYSTVTVRISEPHTVYQTTTDYVYSSRFYTTDAGSSAASSSYTDSTSTASSSAYVPSTTASAVHRTHTPRSSTASSTVSVPAAYISSIIEEILGDAGKWSHKSPFSADSSSARSSMKRTSSATRTLSSSVERSSPQQPTTTESPVPNSVLVDLINALTASPDIQKLQCKCKDSSKYNCCPGTDNGSGGQPGSKHTPAGGTSRPDKNKGNNREGPERGTHSSDPRPKANRGPVKKNQPLPGIPKQDLVSLLHGLLKENEFSIKITDGQTNSGETSKIEIDKALLGNDE
ncbi:hypothetical protein PAPHI01_1173 [Pancytospora philotis]|nr:hypothetical protein PAPHI01_1173 [Pancytospora philotis]